MQHSFWAHYCPCEKGVLWVAHDEECSWCGLTCDPILSQEISATDETPRHYSTAGKTGRNHESDSKRTTG